MNVRHLEHGLKDIVLVPRPTADPDDPLNWSRPRKYLSLFCTMTYVWMIGISSAAIYSVFLPISEATGLPLGDLNAGTGYMFLMFGWGCLFWQPLALTYGRRGVYLFSFIATVVLILSSFPFADFPVHECLGSALNKQRDLDRSSSSYRFLWGPN
jgi:MFS family permease